MLTEQLPHCTLMFEAGNSWKMGQGGQPMTWKTSMETLTSELAHAGDGLEPTRSSSSPNGGWRQQVVWLMAAVSGVLVCEITSRVFQLTVVHFNFHHSSFFVRVGGVR